MDDRRRITLSKYISKHLRHDQEALGLTLEEGGWVSIADLIDTAAKHGFLFCRDELNEMVTRCEKQRFTIDPEGQRIRANQGHSIEVDMNFEPVVPPEKLYHGTAIRFCEAILSVGLIKMSRQHVHLSADLVTAITTGKRHGTPMVFEVDTMRMNCDGFVFFRSTNGVWLIDHVPARYLRKLDT